MNLGPYEIEREVGRGGMGVVLRGKGPDGRVVALKYLLNVAKKDAVARFDREKRLLASLGEEEGFVPLLDSGDSPRGPWFAMPFLSGGTLRAKIALGAFSIDDTVALGVTLARALGRAHAAGIVHRDLKPENVLFDDEGTPLVADLGLAKHFSRDAEGASQSVSLSIGGEARGTAGYMAPEQIDDAKSVGPASDVFALGAMLYECLTGDPAFQGDSAMELIAHIASGSFDPVRKRRPDAPRWLAATIERALARRAADRFADGEALARALEAREADGRSRAPLVLVPAIIIVAGVGVAGLLLGRGTKAPDAGASPRTPVVSGTGEPATRAKLVGSAWGNLNWRHLGPVRSVAFAPDGRTCLSASEDRTVAIRDLSDGHAIRSMTGHDQAATACAFLLDGRRIVTGSEDGTIRLWDVAGQQIWSKPAGRVLALAVSPDGKRLASCGDGPDVTLRDLPSGDAPRPLKGHRDLVRDVAFLDEQHVVSADAIRGHDFDVEYGDHGAFDACATLAVLPASRVISPRRDGNLQVEETSDSVVFALPGPGDTVVKVAASRDGKRAISSSLDGTVRVWDLEKRTQIGTLVGHQGRVPACAFSPDGKHALTGGDDATVRLWDLETYGDLSKHESHSRAVTAIVPLKDGKHVATTSLDGTLVIWNQGKFEKRLCHPNPPPIRACAVLPHEELTLTVGDGGTDAVWTLDMMEGHTFTRAHFDATIRSVTVSPERDLVLTAGDDGNILLYDGGNEPRPKMHVMAHPGGARAVCVTPHGTRALSGGGEGRLVLWDVKSADAIAEIAEVASLSTGVESLALEPDAARAVVGTSDGSVLLVAIGAKTVTKLGTHGAPVAAVLLGRHGRAISAGADGSVRVFDLASGRLEDKISLLPDRPTALALPGDGRRILVGTERGFVLEYELAE